MDAMSAVPDTIEATTRRLGEITTELVNLHRDAAVTSRGILTTRDETWFGLDPSMSVAERDRIASHNVVELEDDLLHIRGEITALTEERDHLRILLTILKDT